MYEDKVCEWEIIIKIDNGENQKKIEWWGQEDAIHSFHYWLTDGREWMTLITHNLIKQSLTDRSWIKKWEQYFLDWDHNHHFFFIHKTSS